MLAWHNRARLVRRETEADKAWATGILRSRNAVEA